MFLATKVQQHHLIIWQINFVSWEWIPKSVYLFPHSDFSTFLLYYITTVTEE